MLCVCMVCGTLGELTKLCAYVYSFVFRYLCIEGEGAGAVAARHTHSLRFPHLGDLLGLYSDILMGCTVWLFRTWLQCFMV